MAKKYDRELRTTIGERIGVRFPKTWVHVICDQCKRRPFIETQLDMSTGHTKHTAFCHGKEEVLTVPENFDEPSQTELRCFRKDSGYGISDKALGPSTKGN